MSKAAWFWIIYVILVLFGCGWTWKDPSRRGWAPVIVVILILIAIVAWAQFGPPIR